MTTNDVLWTLHDTEGSSLDPWTRHPVTKVTDRFVFAAKWAHDQAGPSVRLDRAALESAGSDWSRRHGDRFYTEAAKEEARIGALSRAAEERRKAGIRDLAVGRLQMELGEKLDFAEFVPGVWKAAGFDVYAHDGRQEACSACSGRGKVGRRRCLHCGGKGTVELAWEMARDGRIPKPGDLLTTTVARDLDDVRDMIARGTLRRGVLALVLVADLGSGPETLAFPAPGAPAK